MSDCFSSVQHLYCFEQTAPAPTVTPTATAAAIPTVTRTSTPTPTPTATRTATPSPTPIRTPFCGDGLVIAPEGCDDANTNETDGCLSNCTVHAGFTCTGEPSVCTCTGPTFVCAGNPTPTQTAAVVTPTPTATATPTDKRVFITNNRYTGSLGGLTGGDALCQSAAIGAGLSGTYLAWLSAGSSSPSTRFTHSTGKYVLVDGTTVVANDWTDLTDGTVQSAIALTESGVHIDNLEVWTGTKSNGVPTTEDCVGWTSASSSDTGTIGLERSTALAADWSATGSGRCDVNRYLYCFEQ